MVAQIAALRMEMQQGFAMLAAQAGRGTDADGRGKMEDGEEPAVTLDVGRAAFALLVKLDAQGKQKAPSALTVFRLYCGEALSAGQVAEKCGCSKGTVMNRLQFIHRLTKRKPEHFRQISGHLQQMADDYTNTGAREIYRRGLVLPDGHQG
jgi:hypothetical protein